MFHPPGNYVTFSALPVHDIRELPGNDDTCQRLAPSEKRMTEENQIPLYTKIGMRVTGVLMLLFVFFLARNCVGSFRYGTSTNEAAIGTSYRTGYSAWVDKANGAAVPEVTFDNPVLQKSYMKGFRAGFDEASKKGKREPGTGRL